MPAHDVKSTMPIARRWRLPWTYAAVAPTLLALFCGGLLVWLWAPHASIQSLSRHTVASSTFIPQYDHSHPQHPEPDQVTIPNRVHYVYILDDPKHELRFPFSYYLSVYSTYYYWRPEIYFHTNADDEVIAQARKGASGAWTKRMLEIPSIIINRVPDYRYTDRGREIKKMEARSDFAKVQATHDFGGVYMDFDAHALRDIAPLRKSGFRAVVGRQDEGKINSGVFMSVKDGRVLKAWMDDMPESYVDGWEEHSVDSVTRASEWLVSEPGEVLIMDLAAFGVTSWRYGARHWLFGVHADAKSNIEGVEQGDVLPEHSVNPEARWFHSMRSKDVGSWQRWKKVGGAGGGAFSAPVRPEPEELPDWEHDWSTAYILHAFAHPNDNKAWGRIGPNQISPRYVLARQSNFARAVYPVARHMYERGLITLDDDSAWS